MSNFLFKEIKDDKELERFYYEERFILSVTEKIWSLLEEKAMSKADLAQELGVSRPYVSRLLKGSTNMSLRKLASIAYALDLSIPEVVFHEKEDQQVWVSIGRVKRSSHRVSNDCFSDPRASQQYGNCQIEIAA